jgi:hypothetical protein
MYVVTRSAVFEKTDRQTEICCPDCVLSKLAIPVLPLNAATKGEWITS